MSKVLIVLAAILVFSIAVSSRSSVYYDNNDTSAVGLQKRKHFCISIFCKRGEKGYQQVEQDQQQQIRKPNQQQQQFGQEDQDQQQEEEQKQHQFLQMKQDTDDFRWIFRKS